MIKKLSVLTVLVTVLIATAMVRATVASSISVTIHPRQIRNTISVGIYSQFLEHIYHSADNGLWGEMIWNRSFEEPSGHGTLGQWVRHGHELEQLGTAANVRKIFGHTRWSHYELSLDARKLGGSEGFLVIFDVRDATHFFWLNLGGWGNTQDALQRADGSSSPQIVVQQHPTIHIQKGRWYHIRVRCYGPHIQVWVDKQMLFNQVIQHDVMGAAGGAVGLGTWGTSAAYKNITVTSLTSGKILYQGLPSTPLIKPPLDTRFWGQYGPGTVERTWADPRNSRVCVKIVATGGETGVEQPDICFPNAGIYRGSMWVRGDAAQGMVIRLLDGHVTLAEQSVQAPSSTWHRVDFTFNIKKPVPRAMLQIGVNTGGTADVDEVSVMSDASRKLGGFRPDTLQALKALKPALIRWPGGGYSDSYHWMDGIGPQADRVSEGPMWDDMDPNALGTDEYIHLCRLTGAKPEICINIGPDNADAKTLTQYVQEACHWLQYCNAPASNKWGALRAKYGHPQPYNVKYWEIGNEIWYGQDGLTARKYVKVLRQFVPALKRIDPSIRIIACGSGGLDQEWNSQLLKLAPAGLFDDLSLHQYVPSGAFLSGAMQYLDFVRKTGALIKASSNPEAKVFVSEWNTLSLDWRTGLFAGGILIGFERQSDLVRLSTPALLLRWVWEKDWNNAFINFSRRGWFPAPNYVVEKLWRDHFAKYRIASSSAVPLEADATLTSDRSTVYYKAVNPTDHAVALTLHLSRHFKVASTSAQTVAPGSLAAENTMDQPHNVAVHPLNADVSGQQIKLELAPYSASVVTIKLVGNAG